MTQWKLSRAGAPSQQYCMPWFSSVQSQTDWNSGFIISALWCMFVLDDLVPTWDAPPPLPQKHTHTAYGLMERQNSSLHTVTQFKRSVHFPTYHPWQLNSNTNQLLAICPSSRGKSPNHHDSLPTTLFHTPTMASIGYKFPLSVQLYTNQTAQHARCLIIPMPEADEDKHKTAQSKQTWPFHF